MAQLHNDTERGRILIARAAADQITHLAVGDGPGTAAPDPAVTGLQHETGRVRFAEKKFVTPDPLGAIHADQSYSESAEATRFLYLRFRFLDAEALGPWSEFALCGGGVAYVARAAALSDLTPSVGDDHVPTGLRVLGAYGGFGNQTITVTVVTQGGSGVARISWASSGSAPAGSNVLVSGAAIGLPSTGLSLQFLFPGDAILTAGAQWQIRCTEDSDTAVYAAGGVYDPPVNERGQVKVAGDPVHIWHQDPPVSKTATAVDIVFVYEIIKDAA